MSTPAVPASAIPEVHKWSPPSNKNLIIWVVIEAIVLAFVVYLTKVVPNNNTYGNYEEQQDGYCNLTKTEDDYGGYYWKCPETFTWHRQMPDGRYLRVGETRTKDSDDVYNQNEIDAAKKWNKHHPDDAVPIPDPLKLGTKEDGSVYKKGTKIKENDADYQSTIIKDKPNKRVILNDINHLNPKNKQMSTTVPNAILAVSLVGGVINLLATNWKHGGWKRILHLVLVLIMLITFGMGMRVVTLSTTLLPHPPRDEDNEGTHCQHRKHGFNNWNFSFFGGGSIMGTGSVENCADYMYSGHTLISCIVALFSCYHGNWLVGFILWLIASSQVYILPRARMHYTSDTIVAWVIALLLSTVSTLPVFGLGDQIGKR